ncbi:MAG: GTPase Era [Candidatus Mcinerneyibacterium aminivorans]|uniref:GTPase Era n=1 Tax=Candidatus Mcinerneyibacterium aminivorans TaxID=2703815 RepID=A0A5D0MIQ8_9BACT|nr:MAG: GTPase Era [Candidatus Mcinerneyibacterium aminivorans]
MKSGFVTVIGQPNVGKSSLINSFVKNKISIVTPKPQTTRDQIQAVAHWQDLNTQVVFIDTPGIFKPRRKLDKAMVSRAKKSIKEIELILYMVDAKYKFNERDKKIWNSVELPKDKVFIVLNKTDLISEDEVLESIVKINEYTGIEDIVPVSVLENKNMDKLKNAIVKKLPEGPTYYPSEMLTDKDKKFIISELIRETIINNVYEEIPYVVAISVKDFSDKYIKASIICEQNSQKGILIGKNGKMIKKIGSDSREKIEKFLDRKIYLDLVVNVMKNWRKDKRVLRDLGYID